MTIIMTITDALAAYKAAIAASQAAAAEIKRLEAEELDVLHDRYSSDAYDAACRAVRVAERRRQAAWRAESRAEQLVCDLRGAAGLCNACTGWCEEVIALPGWEAYLARLAAVVSWHTPGEGAPADVHDANREWLRWSERLLDEDMEYSTAPWYLVMSAIAGAEVSEEELRRIGGEQMLAEANEALATAEGLREQYLAEG